MKKILYRKNIDPKNNTKQLSVSSDSQDDESHTYIRKSFAYKVSRTKAIDPEVKAPEVFIRKCFDSKRNIERFRFEVIGSFYMTHNRILVKVDFRHSLNIKILWKKAFSPKKSEVLAE